MKATWYGESAMEAKEIYWLDELSKEYNDIVGKKCANLGELVKLGLRVPYGFALSVKAYEHFMEATGLKDRVHQIVEDAIATGLDVEQDVAKMMKASAQIRGEIEACPMPPDLAAEIGRYYSGLQKKVAIDKVACAVRSSGAVSMPGQMETYLNVVGEEAIIEHVKKVWGSAFTTRAIAFRVQQNMPVSWAPIGVAVIMMIEARCAGVILTVLPNIGDTDRAIVEGNFGLGESVVSGEITPDSFVMHKHEMNIESKSVAEKTKMVVYDTCGTCICDVSDELKNQPCLNDAEILEIVRVAKDVETHFGAPQDMEWAVDKRFPFPESIFWVQARGAKFAKKEEHKDEEYVIDLMLQLFRK
jgi:pyruvate, water dikinase